MSVVEERRGQEALKRGENSFTISGYKIGDAKYIRCDPKLVPLLQRKIGENLGLTDSHSVKYISYEYYY